MTKESPEATAKSILGSMGPIPPPSSSTEPEGAMGESGSSEDDAIDALVSDFLAAGDDPVAIRAVFRSLLDLARSSRLDD